MGHVVDGGVRAAAPAFWARSTTRQAHRGSSGPPRRPAPSLLAGRGATRSIRASCGSVDTSVRMSERTNASPGSGLLDEPAAPRPPAFPSAPTVSLGSVPAMSDVDETAPYDRRSGSRRLTVGNFLLGRGWLRHLGEEHREYVEQRQRAESSTPARRACSASGLEDRVSGVSVRAGDDFRIDGSPATGTAPARRG